MKKKNKEFKRMAVSNIERFTPKRWDNTGENFQHWNTSRPMNQSRYQFSTILTSVSTVFALAYQSQLSSPRFMAFPTFSVLSSSYLKTRG